MEIWPLAVIFVLGYLFHRFGLVKDRHSSLIFKTVFYVGLPFVVFLAINKIHFDQNFVYLALFPPIIILSTVGVALLLRNYLLGKVRAKTFAAMLAGAAIMNQSFLVPFVATSYGPDGLAQLMVIDCFSLVTIFSLLYSIIAVIGRNKPRPSAIAIRVATAPTMWAMLAGIVFKLCGGSIPTSLMNIFSPMTLLVSLSLLFAIGTKFKARLPHPLLFLIQISLRFVLGVAIGICFVKLLGLHGLDAQIIILASAAPIGLNSITLSEVEKLDENYAVSAVIAALLIGLVATPFMVHFVSDTTW